MAISVAELESMPVSSDPKIVVTKGLNMSLRKERLARPLPEPDNEEEFARVSESLSSAIAMAGITLSALESKLPVARAHAFARHYPELVHEFGIVQEPPSQ